MTEAFNTPEIDWAGISPLIALTVGILLVLSAGTLGAGIRRAATTIVTFLTFATTAGLLLWQYDVIASTGGKELVSGALRLDDLAIIAGLLLIASAAAGVALGWRESAFNGIFGAGGQGELHALLMGSVLGGLMLVQAENLVVLFLALELFSIPLYILCGAALRRTGSLESGLKYLIIGSLGSATLLFGSAFVFGATGSTDFDTIRVALSLTGEGVPVSDSILLIGVAFVTAGAAFKLSLAPFHQWTPDVYQGAPTTVTAFMSVATKVVVFALVARLYVSAMGSAADFWQPALAAVAALSIVVGNVGALGQDSLKRLLGYSSIAQGGYMVIGIVVATQQGVNALFFYLVAYALINLSVFAVIALRERETRFGDDIKSIEGLGSQGTEGKLLAIVLTVGMLGLAGLPGTAGFIGKLYLIQAASSDWVWLAILIALGTMVSLVYYLRVVTAVWFRPLPDNWEPLSPEELVRGELEGADIDQADDMIETARAVHALATSPGLGRTVIIGGAVALAALSVFFGVYPQPLVDFVEATGRAIF